MGWVAGEMVQVDVVSMANMGGVYVNCRLSCRRVRGVKFSSCHFLGPTPVSLLILHHYPF